MTTDANDADFAFFTPAVKPLLHRLDLSEDYSRTEGGSVKTQLGPSETAFIAGRDSFYVAAIGEDRWPYTQRHRGPKGFLRVLDATILGFATLAGSRRYISPGNALLFLIDHGLPARLKIWADAEVSEDPAIMEKFAKSRGYTAATHLTFLFHVRAFSWNSEKHTVQRSVREARSTEPVRTGKADPIQPRRCIEQKQRFFSPTLLPSPPLTTTPNGAASLSMAIRLPHLFTGASDD
jgi:predicted pyridoxine 5'-phosphate oxidase superfamily flavin-nucleotide-binding protein